LKIKNLILVEVKKLLFFRDTYYFTTIYDFHLSNIFALCVSAFSSMLITPVQYSIIWFEKDNQNRTLINLLISSLVWCGIAWNIIVQPWTLVLYLIGPINNPLICNIDTVLRNVVLMEASILQVAVFVALYICLFHVKNPTALQEDFWHLFINTWTLGCSLISQSVYILWPGKSPMNYYLCLGEYPTAQQGVPVKANLPLMIAGLFCIIVFIGAKMPNRKLKALKDLPVQRNTHTLFTFTTYSVALVLVVLSSLVLVKINSLEAEELDSYPNYILVYLQHHYLPQIIIPLITLTFFYKKTLLR
jgi:hypothetical protein